MASLNCLLISMETKEPPMDSSVLVRQYDDKGKTLFAGISNTLPLEHETKYPEDEIWIGQIMVVEPQRYSLKGTRYEGWSLEDIITVGVKVSELKKIE